MDKNFDFSTFIVVLVKRRYFIIFNFIFVCIIAGVYTFFFVEKQYMSSLTFLPPSESQSISSLLQLSNFSNISSTEISPHQITSLFESKELRRKIIDRFNLYQHYKLTNSKNKFEQAIKILKKEVVMTIFELGGLGVTTPMAFTIKTYHTSPDTCYLMAKYVFFLMDSTIREMSVESGKRNKLFVQKQLVLNKNILDSLQEEFGKYQIQNKVFDIPSQVQLALSNYGQIKAQLLINEIKIKSLEQDYNNKYPLIGELQKENIILNGKLKQLEELSNPDVFIGLEQSVYLTPKFTNYIRSIEVQNQLILLLTKQYEEAKLKEARDLSTLKVIDNAFIPEYKARPKRILIGTGIIGIYMVVLFSGLFFQHFYEFYIKNTQLFHEIINTLRKK